MDDRTVAPAAGTSNIKPVAGISQVLHSSDQIFIIRIIIAGSDPCILKLKERNTYKISGRIKNTLKDASSSSGVYGINLELDSKLISFDKFCQLINHLWMMPADMNLLTRDYDQLRTNYQTLLDKKMQSQMAENLERRQQSEQFKILDPARMPEKPIRPKAHIIFPAGIALGLMLGGGLAWLRESMDQSFHSDQDVEDFLGLKVLITIPNAKRE